jgi:hypothetical protein
MLIGEGTAGEGFGVDSFCEVVRVSVAVCGVLCGVLCGGGAAGEGSGAASSFNNFLSLAAVGSDSP